MIVLRDTEKLVREDRALLIDAEEGLLIKPVLDPVAEKGSLKRLFAGRTSGQLLRGARSGEADV